MTAAALHGTVAGLHVWRAGMDAPEPVDPLVLDHGGPVGDRHHGETMASDVRQRWLYSEGTQIRNNRQVTVVDAGELAQVASRLGLDELAPGTIADNICTTGIDALTGLVPMTRLLFVRATGDLGAVIVIGGENLPCTIAGALVADRYGTRPEKFPKASIHLRGVSGWVERAGEIRVGDGVRVVPPRPTA
ncbi:MAG: hypothetical protein ABI586_05715 [Candidatus Nanopelagicales bacterium]